MSETSNVLIVEDDPVIASLMADVAGELGYGISQAETLDQAKRQSVTQLPDLVILDRMLGDGSEGLDYIEWLNALEGKRPGILIASRLSSVSDHVLGLETGADDYINKPFEREELRARLRAVARRAASNRAPASVLIFDTLEIRKSSAQALVNNTPLPLRPQSFALLKAIAERQGEWVSRKALWHEVWTDYKNLSPQDTVINTAISRLRGVLSAVEGAPEIVSENLGYRLVSQNDRLLDSETV
ncbi:two-component response regulator [Methylophaga frappieri]|jgi:DNA-binding response OmpR family regulator|uniref:Two-component response regulator n=2 Tax=Methylophaga frappieri (strain ATCC BAA-2434 / DSM 25690 / JAM7) TaxID=754477 RepID=I1YIG9_METFJ|nr:two-component response regulator [Methylophaga frappieri]